MRLVLDEALNSAIVAAMVGGAIGAMAGSFLATLVLRWPHGRSIAHGRSRCDACGKVLGPVSLIPLVVRRRCAACDGPIDPIHWQMEWAAAVIGAAALALGPGLSDLAGPRGLLAGCGWALLGWILLALGMLDARHFWLPDRLTLPLGATGLAMGGLVSGASSGQRLWGAAAGAASLAAIGWLYRRFRHREGLGLGDAKLFGALGAWFGWPALPFVLLGASVLGLAGVLGQFVLGRMSTAARPLRADQAVPLGTLLCLAAVPGWLAARTLLAG